MYCPNCGKADQKEKTYCRNCGEFLSDFSKKKKNSSLGGDTPEEQITTNLYLNLLSGFVSLALAIALYVTFIGQTAAPVIYLTIGFLLAMCGWQFTTFRIGLKLKNSFSKRRENTDLESVKKAKNQMESVITKELLKEADFENVVPTSVTENTTKTLSEKVKTSTQTEHQSDRTI